jgi:hypothetical protein
MFYSSTEVDQVSVCVIDGVIKSYSRDTLAWNFQLVLHSPEWISNQFDAHAQLQYLVVKKVSIPNHAIGYQCSKTANVTG